MSGNDCLINVKIIVIMLDLLQVNYSWLYGMMYFQIANLRLPWQCCAGHTPMSWSSVRMMPFLLTWWSWPTASSFSCSERGQRILTFALQATVELQLLLVAVLLLHNILESNIWCGLTPRKYICFSGGTGVKKEWCLRWMSGIAFASTKQPRN